MKRGRKAMSRLFVAGLMLLIFWLLPGCGHREPTAEEQIKQFVVAGEEAAGERDLRAIRALIADGYHDRRQQTKMDLVRLVAGYFLRHKHIHLLSRIKALRFPEPDRAELQLLVAMADVPLDFRSLLQIQADLYRFDLVLNREGDQWLLVEGSWQRAVKEDFAPEKQPDSGEQ